MSVNVNKFNVHRTRTTDGVVITRDLVVYTNEMKIGRVTGDRDEQSCCQQGSHTARQVQIGVAVFTDHSVSTMCLCGHDHWFYVTLEDGRTSSMNGERLSTTFKDYDNVLHVAAQEAGR